MTEQGYVLMYRSLASVARLELKALMEETKSAIDSLGRQRECAAQAIAIAHQAKEIGDYLPDETELQLSYLGARLDCLEAALTQVSAELDGLEEMPVSPRSKVVPALLTPLMETGKTSYANFDQRLACLPAGGRHDEVKEYWESTISRGS
jgi:hypothetical protein